jgi:hypothetical protein
MEICRDNLPWKVYNQFVGGADTSTLGKATGRPIARQNYRSFVVDRIRNS